MQTRRQFLAQATAASLLGWRGVRAQAPQSVPIPGVEVGEVTKLFALRNVTVIDGTGAPARPGMTVVIAGSRIQSVTPQAKLAPEMQVVDADGKFLIPGLWDTHTHLDNPASLPLFVANGVTATRLMDSTRTPFESLLSLRAEIAAGQRLGPRLVVPVYLVGADGLYGRGPAPVGAELLASGLVNTVEEARSGVRRATQSRADFVKVHTPMARDLFFAILSEARDLRIPVAGHVPQASAMSASGKPEATLVEASNAGLASIEHVEHLLTHINKELGGPAGVGMDGLTSSQAAAMSDLFALFKKNNTWFCPSLTDTPRSVPIVATDSRLRYFDAAQRQVWTRNAIPADRLAIAQRNYRSMLSYTAALHKAGVGLLAGTDARREFGMPGFWLHEELKQMVAAGLSPMDALRAATYKPAQFLGLLNTMGTVEAGKLSEMVLLDANPLDDITNTTRINMVFTGGRVYRRQALDKVLAAVEENARN